MFLQEMQHAARFYWSTLKFIDRHNLWRTMLIPALFNLGAATLVALLAWKTSGYVAESALGHIRGDTADGEVAGVVRKFFLLGIRGIVLFLYLKVFRYIILVVYAPIYTWLSTRIQPIITHATPKNGTSASLAHVMRSSRIAARHFLLEIVLTVMIILVSLLVTWLLPLAPLAILALESYYFGYSMAEYRNMYEGIAAHQSGKVIRSHIGLVLGNGLFFNIFLLVPVLGVLFAPQLALISAAMSFHCAEKRKSILCPSSPSTLSMAKS